MLRRDITLSRSELMYLIGTVILSTLRLGAPHQYSFYQDAIYFIVRHFHGQVLHSTLDTSHTVLIFEEAHKTIMR